VKRHVSRVDRSGFLLHVWCRLEANEILLWMIIFFERKSGLKLRYPDRQLAPSRTFVSSPNRKVMDFSRAWKTYVVKPNFSRTSWAILKLLFRRLNGNFELHDQYGRDNRTHRPQTVERAAVVCPNQGHCDTDAGQTVDESSLHTVRMRLSISSFLGEEDPRRPLFLLCEDLGSALAGSRCNQPDSGGRSPRRCSIPIDEDDHGRRTRRTLRSRAEEARSALHCQGLRRGSSARISVRMQRRRRNIFVA